MSFPLPSQVSFPNNEPHITSHHLTPQSGSRNEKGIRRAAEEEHPERGREHGESAAEFRHGGVDGGQDVGGDDGGWWGGCEEEVMMGVRFDGCGPLVTLEGRGIRVMKVGGIVVVVDVEEACRNRSLGSAVIMAMG